MTELVTTAEAYAHLRIDGAGDDTWLAIFIPAISESVLNWLKDEWRAYRPATYIDSNGDTVTVVDSNGDPVPYIDSNGEMIPHWVVKAAVLIELGSVYRWRDGSGKDNVVPASAGHGYVLNKASTALLEPLRKSTVA